MSNSLRFDQEGFLLGVWPLLKFLMTRPRAPWMTPLPSTNSGQPRGQGPMAIRAPPQWTPNQLCAASYACAHADVCACAFARICMHGYLCMFLIVPMPIPLCACPCRRASLPRHALGIFSGEGARHSQSALSHCPTLPCLGGHQYCRGYVAM